MSYGCTNDLFEDLGNMFGSASCRKRKPGMMKRKPKRKVGKMTTKRKPIKKFKDCKLIEKTGRGGFIKQIENPCGTKPAVYIFQGERPGFTAAYERDHRRLPGSSRNAETYGRMLAKSGHRRVTFRD